MTGLKLGSGGVRGCPVVGETASEERARDIYGRGAGFLVSSGNSGGSVGNSSSRGIKSSSIPNSSMSGRGGGRSTMASRSWMVI
jgi:hypothetical protein